MVTQANKCLLAFHNDLVIRERYLARVRAHRAADDIIRGQYGRAEGKSGWRGCAIGCTLHGSSHAAYEEELGIPRVLARIEDTLFERMPASHAPDWPVEFLEAIPVGADLSLVVWQLMERGIRDLLRFATEATRPAMDRVLSEVLEPRARGEEVSADAAYAAADDAYAADDAVYAAYAAAYAANAVADAAYAANYANYAADAANAAADANMAYHWSRWLLELMAAAPVPAEARKVEI